MSYIIVLITAMETTVTVTVTQTPTKQFEIPVEMPPYDVTGVEMEKKNNVYH